MKGRTSAHSFSTIEHLFSTKNVKRAARCGWETYTLEKTTPYIQRTYKDKARGVVNCNEFLFILFFQRGRKIKDVESCWISARTSKTAIFVARKQRPNLLL